MACVKFLKLKLRTVLKALSGHSVMKFGTSYKVMERKMQVYHPAPTLRRDVSFVDVMLDKTIRVISVEYWPTSFVELSGTWGPVLNV